MKIIKIACSLICVSLFLCGFADSNKSRSISTVSDIVWNSYLCNQCGSYVYDPTIGCPDRGIAPGTPWACVSPSFVCPLCGAPKFAFIQCNWK